MPDLSPTTFKPILLKLIKSPQDFGTQDVEAALDHVITPGATLPEQVGAFLTGLAVARVELRRDIVIAAATFIYSRSIPAVVFDADKDFIVDIVGTGGDGHNTFNVSTTAAIVAAGADVRVIKVKKLTVISFLPLLANPDLRGLSMAVEHRHHPLALQIYCKPSDAFLYNHEQ
jgi:anthranilate phosphoribosyltransferase